MRPHGVGGGPGRAGTALVDLVTALVLAAVLGAALTALLGAQFRLAARVNARAAAAEVERTAAVVLLAELRGLDPARDVAGLGPDSVALRAFRGVGVVCAVTAAGAVARFRGSRAPDLGKDSLLVLRAGAELPWAPAAIVAATHACVAAGEKVFRLTPPGPLQPGDVLLLFERGSYHLAEGALRYRRGAGGRQPLTHPLLLPGSGFTAVAVPGRGASTLRAHLSIGIPGEGGATSLDLRVTFPNGGAP